MTWDLEADVDLEPARGGELVRALAGFLADDVAGFTLEVTRGDWPPTPLASHAFPDLAAMLAAISDAQAADRTVLARLALRGAEAPMLEVWLFGADLAAMGGQRRRAPAVIGLGDRKKWRGHATLPSGRRLDDALLVQLLQHVCTTVQPAALYLGSEEGVSIPFNDHFVYHRALDGFLGDLADICQLSLRGGDVRYPDARARYEPALADDARMMLGKRRDDYLDVVRRFLAAKLPRLEAAGLPATLSLADVETAVLSEDDLQFFFTEPGPGLGVHPRQLFTGYVEGIYFRLIELLLDRPA